MTPYALISAACFLVGMSVGLFIVPAIIEHYVRAHGSFVFKWSKRWYRVQEIIRF